MVLIYKDQASRGKRKVKGRFHSAIAEAITLDLSGGYTNTFQKLAVRRILVDRPPYEGWITAGASTAVFVGLAPGWDLNGREWALFGGLFVGVPTVIAFLVAPKTGGIYNVPPDRRAPSSTKTKPSQDRSTATVPEVKDSEGSPTGSGLENNFLLEDAGPDSLRQQARQALVRKGLPLDLPDLPVRSLSAELTVKRTAFDGSFPRSGEFVRGNGFLSETRGSWLHPRAFRQRGGDVPPGQRVFPGSTAGAHHRTHQDSRWHHRATGSGVFRPRTSDNLEETMVKTNTTFWKLPRRSTAAGLVLLLVLVGWPPTAAAKIKSDWSRVQRVTPGTRTTVWLYKDQVPPGRRKIKGRFRSATSESITLMLPDGQMQTLGKRAVRQVLTRRPFSKRYQGWIALGVTATLVGLAARSATDPGDVDTGELHIAMHSAVTLPVTLFTFLVAPKMVGIYSVPPDRRDPSSTGTKPPQNRSTATVTEVKKSEGSPAGLGVEDISSPDRLRQRARQGLLRKGLPLDLPDLTVRGLSAERTGMQTTFDGSFPRADEVSRRARLGGVSYSDEHSNPPVRIEDRTYGY